jgi:hypothetical protein
VIHFVVHEEGDGVGVVVVEGVKSGQPLSGWIMEDDKDIGVTAKGDIPIATRSRSRTIAPATPSSSTASTSARSWRRSRRASTCTSTT